MFEKLIEIIIQFWHALAPAAIIRHYQVAAVLRFGVFHRKVGAGLCWKWPVVEEINEFNASITTLRLPPQSLTTKDGVSVVVAAIVKYQIRDVEPYITRIWDQHDVLADVTMGSIRHVVLDMDYAQLVTGDPERDVLAKVRAQINQFGFQVHAITFTDLCRVRSYRLIQQVAKDIDN